MENLIETGYIIKTHGYKGDVRVRFYDNIRIIPDLPRAFFLNLREEYVPYFTDSMDFFTDTEALIHFQGIDNKEEAHQLKGSTLYLKEEEVEHVVETGHADDFTGYAVSDLAKGEIGIVEKVLSYPQQDLLSVRYGDRNVLIPLRFELIHHVDEEKKEVTFDLPDGLLEL